MCGIAGMVMIDSAAIADEAAVQRMTDALVHRGPDSGGVWTSRNAALGARRLRVLDLAAGEQPLTSPDDRYVIVYNGEIYNHREVRVELETKGVTFKTHCDTETVLAAYAAWGTNCLARFNGMFAFAIHDTHENTLFLARDRLGVKPLFYSQTPDAFVFASELDALMRSQLLPRDIDRESLADYFRYLYVPAPDTIYRGISKLLPGESILLKNGRMETQRWWSPRLNIDSSWTLDSAAERFRELLFDSVRLRLISDVPLGAFLSGGVDSSCVVAAMAQHAATIKTFSIGFDDAAANELPYAREVATRFGTHHTEEIVRPDAVALLPQIVRHFGEPFADSSAIPTWYVSQLARRNVTVALSGDGGDELFAGYDWTRMNRLVARYRRVPGGIRRLIDLALGALPDSERIRKLARFSADSFLSPLESFRRRQTSFSPRELDELLLGGATATRDRFAEVATPAETMNSDDWMLLHDLLMYLPDDILTKVDRMSMAHALEARVPLLDYRLVEFAMTVPFHLKAAHGVTKRVMKHACGDLLPESVMRQRKRGFAIPIHKWFRGPLREIFHDTVLSKSARSRESIDTKAAARFLDRHTQRGEDLGHHLWAVLVLEHWLAAAR
ncbi:MAG: asparagine synthase (glutamine-hydrolyzing) [Candidatus Hydrogenedentota bacterium]